jgi:ribosomal protein L36
MKDDVLVVDGEVIENLPNTLFRVKLNDSEKVILCYLSGKMRKITSKFCREIRSALRLPPTTLIKDGLCSESDYMHIQSSITKRCTQCKIVKRRGKLYITCTNPKHKQRQG